MRVNSIRMKNFRQHADSRIDVLPEHRIVAVRGPNGSGKSTVLEAMLYALYGETRHGRSGVGALVRRGHEIEGLLVEMSFSVAGVTWRVVRRKDQSKSSAVLYKGENPFAEGVRPVSAEIAAILGYDSKSFRMAYLAEQKELDALGKLGASARRKQVERFLRLDEIQKASAAQNDKAKDLRNALRDMAAEPDMKSLKAALKAATEQERSADANTAEARSARDSAAQEYAELRDSSADWSKRNDEAARTAAEAKATASAVAEAQRSYDKAVKRAEFFAANSSITAELSTPPRIEKFVSATEERLALQRAAIDDAVASNAAASHAAALRSDLVAAEQEQSALPDRTDPAKARKAAQAARKEADKAAAAADTAEAELRAAVAHSASAQERLKMADDALQKKIDLPPSCDECGQPVPDDYKDESVKRARSQAEQARREADGAAASLKGLEEACKSASANAQKMSESANKKDRTAQAAESAHASRRSVTERIEILKDRIEQLGPAEEVDLDPLRNVAAELDTALADAAHMLSLLSQREEHKKALSSRKSAATKAAKAAESAALSAADIEAQERFAAAADRAQHAEAALRDAAVSHEQATAARTAAESALRSAEKIRSARSDRRARAEVAAKAADLLDWLAGRIGQSAVPKLEASASDTVRRLTSDRYSRVSLDESYTPTVHSSSGAWQFADLSGGEQDVVSLSMRLAAAELSKEWSSADDSEGFLVLDEPFGSQDADRRESLVDHLQGLRSDYSQVWCISHIGGVEEAADLVIEVEHTPDGSIVL